MQEYHSAETPAEGRKSLLWALLKVFLPILLAVPFLVFTFEFLSHVERQGYVSDDEFIVLANLSPLLLALLVFLVWYRPRAMRYLDEALAIAIKRFWPNYTPRYRGTPPGGR